MPRPILFIGNKNYSSWSLRPWLCLRWGKIDFEERLISLRQEGYGTRSISEVCAVSPGGTVPALHVGDARIWDSLAIAEWAAEQVAPGALWPAGSEPRAVARSVTCEMHSGFAALRDDLPMNIERRSAEPAWRDATKRDIRRIIEIWVSLRERFASDGPWLFGQRCIADAFFAPVVTRFRTYGVTLPQLAKDYSATVLADPDFQAWEQAPITDRFPFIDDVYR